MVEGPAVAMVMRGRRPFRGLTFPIPLQEIYVARRSAATLKMRKSAFISLFPLLSFRASCTPRVHYHKSLMKAALPTSSISNTPPSERPHIPSSLHSQSDPMTTPVVIDAQCDPESRQWHPHRDESGAPSSGPGNDWVSEALTHLDGARSFRPAGALIAHPLRVLILHGTLREKGFSKALAYECARILDGVGCDVRCFDPTGLPVRDPEISDHPKVVELRSLVHWSEAHVWCGAELHGNLCSVFKNQIDWIPLNTGSVRPTQGKSVAVLQVNGGSQSFNVVNTLRLLARWMRMNCTCNQSSVPMAWKEFDEDGRMKESSLRERVVDVMEEFVKTARVNREYADFFTDRYSERKERAEKGRLLTQAEKEAAKEKELKNN